ncbi:YgiQ family radical SAM protein [uncultured Phascolarctobacterium sp.]|uniref:YgiQ family radical SAM protein n=1 Tax=uncultured Phascolarctobacterium sp. TaxID=512296 RepID=UPI002612A8CB|nr:YgiQ family radical SAM protein [uncultured Phascolarctobacterium sp.]
MKQFIPISHEEIVERGWEQIDFLFISGDAYVDHPSFGPAVICRVLEAHGYKVAMLCQPAWDKIENFAALGKPRLGVMISGGNLDSMLCRYTVGKHERAVDKYTAGGEVGKRPDHATCVYAQKVKKLWPELPVVIGGIEASLRRFVHFDYWENKLLPSILESSGADVLVYGMGEKQVVEIADYLAGGARAEDLHYIRGTAYAADALPEGEEYVELPGWAEITADRKEFARAFRLQSREQDPFYGKMVVQKGQQKYIVQNPSIYPLTMEEMDAVYDLPYVRTWHPSYDELGGVAALEEVQFSLVSCRGCFGSCSFCAIHAHQGRIIQARSHESILREAKLLIKLPGFKGYIHDVGGPTANFRHPACAKQLKYGVCKDRQCLFPKPCPNLDADHSDYVALLRKLRALPGVKKVFIRSGIRYDYLLADKKQEFLDELCRYHISGLLKVAPEHIAPQVLAKMGKPGKDVYLKFMRAFTQKNKEIGLPQYLVPYFISSHPGCTLNNAIELAEFLRDIKHQPEQVQDFIPTPGSAATAMYYSGVDPESGQSVFVARNPHDKAMQRALMQYRAPRNRKLVLEALQKAGRMDLVGSGHKCLLHTESSNGRPDKKGPRRPNTGDRRQNKRRK